MRSCPGLPKSLEWAWVARIRILSGAAHGLPRRCCARLRIATAVRSNEASKHARGSARVGRRVSPVRRRGRGRTTIAATVCLPLGSIVVVSSSDIRIIEQLKATSIEYNSSASWNHGTEYRRGLHIAGEQREGDGHAYTQ